MEIGNQSSSDWEAWNLVSIIKLVFFLIIDLIILALNSAVIVAFVKYSSVRTPTNYFLLSLVIADLLIAMLSIPGHLLGEFEAFGDNELACVVINSPTLVMPCAALLSLVSASVERYIAVVYPLRYQTLNSRKYVLLIIVIIWIYSVTLGVIPVAGINNIVARAELNSSLPFCNFIRVTPGKYVGFVAFSTFVPGMIVLAAVNIRIFLVAHYQRRKVQQLRPIREMSTTTMEAKPKRTVMFVLLMLGHIYFLTHIPFMLAMAIDYEYFTLDLVQVVSVPFELYVLTTSLVAMCPIAYPLVMAFGNREIRTYILKMCPKRINRRQVTFINTAAVTHQT